MLSTFIASVLLDWLAMLGLIPWILSGVESCPHVSEAILHHLTFLVLSILSTLSIPWKLPSMGSSLHISDMISCYKTFLFLGFLLTSSVALLYMLLTFIAPVLLNWLAMLHFLELHSVALLCMLLTFIAPVLLNWLALIAPFVPIVGGV
jgi:hypothetical protein